MYIDRTAEHLQRNTLASDDVVVLLGPPQVGKTIDDETFLNRIRVVVLGDAKIDSVEDRIQWTKYWGDVKSQLDAEVAYLGSNDKNLHEAVQHWQIDLGRMLSLIADRIRFRPLRDLSRIFDSHL
jgi:hypothetical protein